MDIYIYIYVYIYMGFIDLYSLHGKTMQTIDNLLRDYCASQTLTDI